MQPKKEIQHPPLKTFEKKMWLKEQHPTELQSRNPGPRSNKTNGISSMQARSRVSFVVFMSCTFTIFAWFRRVNNLHLLLFYLQYPPPVCLVCCIPRVQTIFATFLSLVSPTYFACFTTHTGSELHVTACITFQFSWSHHPFTWLQTLLWIDFATP